MWLKSQQEVVSRLPPIPPPYQVQIFQPAGGETPPPQFPRVQFFDEEPERVIVFPVIEEARKDLIERELMTPDEYYNRENMARLTGFTVSKVTSFKALADIREALAEDVGQGGTLRDFQDRVDVILGTGVLSKARVELVYRTNLAKAYSQGIEKVLNHPLVTTAFPFEETVPVKDSRLTKLCEIVSRSGINGTGIYLRDDPEWQRLKCPRHWQCRCTRVPIDLETAAARGIEYAQKWLENGSPPAFKPFVPRVPVELPKGWTPGGL